MNLSTISRPRVNRLPLAAGDRSIARPRSNTVLRPVHGSIRLFAEINGQLYALKPLQPHPEVASKAWQLRKPDGTTYHICRGPHGPECSCPSWVFDRANTNTPCKHVAALLAASLL